MAQRIALESLTRRNGLAVFPPSEIAVDSVAAAVAACVGYAGVVAAQRQSGGVTVYVAEEAMAARLVETGLTVGELHLRCAPLSTPAVRVALSGAPPFLSSADILRDLHRYGTAVSKITLLPLRTRDPRLAHVLSLQRQVFMVLKDDNVDLDVNFKYTVQGHVYTVRASTAGKRCYVCGGKGHARRNCPSSANGFAVPPATARVEQPEQQRKPRLQPEQQQHQQRQHRQQRQHQQRQHQQLLQGRREDPVASAAGCVAPTLEGEHDGATCGQPTRRKVTSGPAAEGGVGPPSKRTVVAGDDGAPEDRTAAATEGDGDDDGGELRSSDDAAVAERPANPGSASADPESRATTATVTAAAAPDGAAAAVDAEQPASSPDGAGAAKPGERTRPEPKGETPAPGVSAEEEAAGPQEGTREDPDDGEPESGSDSLSESGGGGVVVSSASGVGGASLPKEWGDEGYGSDKTRKQDCDRFVDFDCVHDPVSVLDSGFNFGECDCSDKFGNGDRVLGALPDVFRFAGVAQRLCHEPQKYRVSRRQSSKLRALAQKARRRKKKKEEERDKKGKRKEEETKRLSYLKPSPVAAAAAKHRLGVCGSQASGS